MLLVRFAVLPLVDFVGSGSLAYNVAAFVVIVKKLVVEMWLYLLLWW